MVTRAKLAYDAQRDCNTLQCGGDIPREGGRPMKLYMHPISTTSRPVRLFVAEHQIPVEEEAVDIMTGAQYNLPYSAVNPNCLLPMLEDASLRLTESSAIPKYLPTQRGSPVYPTYLQH